MPLIQMLFSFLSTGVLITSNADITVQAGSINHLSSDTFLALPSHVLGTSYYAMTYLFGGDTTQHHQGPAELAVVGVFDKTKITIQLPTGMKIKQKNILHIVISRFETYQVSGHERQVGKI